MNYQKEKGAWQKKAEDLKKKYQVLSDEYLDKKISYEKESALVSQQNSFLNSKVNDLIQQVDFLHNQQEEKVKAIRQELLQDTSEKV